MLLFNKWKTSGISSVRLERIQRTDAVRSIYIFGSTRISEVNVLLIYSAEPRPNGTLMHRATLYEFAKTSSTSTYTLLFEEIEFNIL